MGSTPWQERYADKVMTARDALRVVKRGDTVFVGSGASGPQVLVEEMAKWADDFADLKVFFRPIRPTDEAMMQELFYSLSEDSIYYRFFHRTQVMPHKKVQRFTTVDYQKDMAIVGLVEEEGREKIIGVSEKAFEIWCPGKQ